MDIIRKDKNIKIVKKATTDKPKFNIVKVEKESKLPKEAISKILNIDWKRLSHTLQKTPANCGPLSITNGLHALTALNDNFIYPDNFPKTSDWIRKLLWEDNQLRSTTWWPFGFEVTQDNFALNSEIIYNLVDRLTQTSNLQIVWDRFAPSRSWGIALDNVYNVFDQSDWIIVNQNFHYKSYVRIDKDNRLCVDSLSNPYKISDEDLKKSIDNRWIFIGIKCNNRQ